MNPENLRKMKVINLKRSAISAAQEKMEKAALEFSKTMYEALYELLGSQYESKINGMTQEIREDIRKEYDIDLLIEEGKSHGAFEVDEKE